MLTIRVKSQLVSISIAKSSRRPIFEIAGRSMLRTTKIDCRSYYNTLPPLGHSCGDVWRNMPSFGILGDTTCSGLVITPACDLSWYKSDTLTYLPIISIRSFFSTDAAIPAVLEKVKQNIDILGYDMAARWTAKAYILPSPDEIASIRRILINNQSNSQRPTKEKQATERALAGIEILNHIAAPHPNPVPVEKLSCCFGSEWKKIKEKIITNSHSPAIHFLPCDEQDLMFSGIPEHSVALFRCPITVPVKILNYAEESSDNSWCERVQNLAIPNMMQDAFLSARPIKMSSLKPAFLSDLLTRFSALYNRIGSPDFSKETVESYSQEVDL